MGRAWRAAHPAPQPHPNPNPTSWQAFLSGIETVSNAGLPSEYYNTPSKYVAYGFLAVVGLLVAAYVFQQ
jgi:hypothetical protein